MGILTQSYITSFNIIEKLRVVQINCILNLHKINILLYYVNGNLPSILILIFL